jgi:F0F1-type ATP synthase beta subunit
MSTGTTVQVIGAVVDVEFPAGQIPKIYDALISTMQKSPLKFSNSWATASYERLPWAHRKA